MRALFLKIGVLVSILTPSAASALTPYPDQWYVQLRSYIVDLIPEDPKIFILGLIWVAIIFVIILFFSRRY